MFQRLAAAFSRATATTPEPESSNSQSTSATQTPNKSIPISSINLVYGKKSILLEFDESDSDNKAKPELGPSVGYVRGKVAEWVDTVENKATERGEVALVFSGKRLVNDDIPLIGEGIKSKDTLLVSIRKPKTRSKKAKKNKAKKNQQITKPAPLTGDQKIDAVLKSTEETILPLINKFVDSPPEDEEAKKEQHRRLGELVLTKLFSLDEVDTSGNPGLRQKRKEAVNTLHGYHAKIDSVLQSDNKENENEDENKSKDNIKDANEDHKKDEKL